MSPRRRGAFGAAPLLAGLLLACAAEEPPPLNVLLVVVDTLRADHLGCYGATRDVSPAIDALAAGGVRFERAYSTAAWTSPAVASILTGLHPSAHGVNALTASLSQEAETLAEILARHGFETAGVVSHVLLSSERGFAQGFDTYSEDEARGHDHVSTPAVTRRARVRLAELVQKEAPFFLFVHYFDPHFRYMQHDDIEFAAERAGRLEGGEPISELRARLGSFSETEVRFLRDLYDEEIRFTDAGIGKLLKALQTHGIEDETLVILTADHGEELLERGWLGHSRTLYEELIRVPLIVRAPFLEFQTVSRPVSLVSIAPTVLDWIGLEPAGRFEGRSLAPLLRHGRRSTVGPAFAERVAQTAAIDGRFKLIRSDLDGEPELYDLSADPQEQRNLAAHRPDLLAALGAELSAHLRASRGRAIEARDLELSEGEMELLHELGYTTQ